MNKTLVLIDAGFLSKLSKSLGEGKYLKYDLIRFCNNLSKKEGLSCEHIFYYTSPPYQSPKPTQEESERYQKYEKFRNNLIKNKIISVREGRCQRLKIDGEFVYGQKGVDALVIIDLMSVLIDYKEVKSIILIANDSDFVPVIKKLEESGIKVILYTKYVKNRKSSFSRSNELINSVSKYVQLTKGDFDCCKLE